MSDIRHETEAKQNAPHKPPLDPHLKALENEAIHIFREVAAEFDAERNMIKVNALADWDIDQIKAYVASENIPVNPLHARGYPSIGCEPCTRAIKPGEPERAGRWWWENDEKRECGLHVAGADQTSAISAIPQR